MNRVLFAFSAATLALAFALFTSQAHAVEPEAAASSASTPAASSVAPGTPITSREASQTPDENDVKHVALAINPLGVTIGRYSIQGEYVFAKHNAITLNPFYTHATVTQTVNNQDIDAGSLSGFGGELGYRFYTGSKGPNGFFIGPSFLFSSFSQSLNVGGQTIDGKSFTSIGGALDIGGQALIGPGILIGAGFGLQYTKNSEELETKDLNIASAVIAGGGIRPRFLLSLGYAF